MDVGERMQLETALVTQPGDFTLPNNKMQKSCLQG